MHRFIVALSCFLLTLAAPISAQDFDKGLAAYKKEDYATAFQEFKPFAEQGHAAAQYNLGQLYRQGQDTPQDYSEAAKWYTLAAE